MTATKPGVVGTAQGMRCTHCTLPVPAGLIAAGADRQFCCSACRTAYAIINEHGLDDYYAFAERRDRPVTASGRGYEEFDHDAFRAIYVQEGDDGLSECDLYVDGVHCASCVWLVEKVPLAIPGVVSAELDIGRSRCRVRWDRGRTPLSAIARFLDTLGYVAHPFRGARADERRRREDRASLVNIGIAGAIAGNVMMIALAIYAGWFGGIDPDFERYFRWWSFLLTTPAMLWPGRVFFKSAWGALRHRALHMDVPIAVAIAAGYLRGAVNTFTDTGPVYFDGVATLIFLLLDRVGRMSRDGAPVKVVLSFLSITSINAVLVGVNAVMRAPRSGSEAQRRGTGILLDLARLVVVLVASAVVASSIWGVNLGGLLTALGVGSVVLGLALQDTVSGLFAGMSLLSGRHFKEGDWIESGGIEGKIVHMNWRTVTIETLDDEKLVVIPNSTLASEPFTVLTTATRTFGSNLQIRFAYGTPPAKAMSAVERAIESVDIVLPEPPYDVDILAADEQVVDAHAPPSMEGAASVVPPGVRRARSSPCCRLRCVDEPERHEVLEDPLQVFHSFVGLGRENFK